MGKSHGMLFSAPMVRALLAGTKSQTRRIISPRNSLFDGGPVQKKLWALLDWGRAYIDKGPSPAGNSGPYWHVPYTADDEYWARIYPRIQAGDEIWVRETFCETDAGIAYRASTTSDSDGERCRQELGYKWKPAIHLPRKASRIMLAVPTVRTERLQSISAEDALAEGINHYSPGITASERGESEGDPVEEYRALWNSINGPISWESNPPVWIYNFGKKQLNSTP